MQWMIQEAAKHGLQFHAISVWAPYASKNPTIAIVFLRHYGWLWVGSNSPAIAMRYTTYERAVTGLSRGSAARSYEWVREMGKSNGLEMSSVRMELENFVDGLESMAKADAEIAAQDFLAPFCHVEQHVEPGSAESKLAQERFSFFAKTFRIQIERIGKLGGVSLNPNSPQPLGSATSPRD